MRHRSNLQSFTPTSNPEPCSPPSDFYSGNPVESIWMSIFLLYCMVLSAYILGTVTLLMVKGDKRAKVGWGRVGGTRGQISLAPRTFLCHPHTHVSGWIQGSMIRASVAQTQPICETSLYCFFQVLRDRRTLLTEFSYENDLPEVKPGEAR